MNTVAITGRFTKDPDVRYTNNGASVARFSIAVDRRFKTQDGPTADFINCVAFGKTAEFIEKYFNKGMKIEISGRIQTGSYTKEDGAKVFTTDVVAESVGFAESKSASSSTSAEKPATADDGFMNIPDSLDEELPFS